MTQHATLSAERWSSFDLGQQILMISNEMNRAIRLIERKDQSGISLAYERVLRLVDLTIEIQTHYGLRRELLRWRDLIAEMYVRPDLPLLEEHVAVFRCLLQLNPVASRQIPFVLGNR